MSTISKLKLVTNKRVRVVDPVQYRRNKLAAGLSEQMELAAAQRDGGVYAPKRLKSVTDPNTGARTVVETAKRVREWYWPSESGRVNLALRYGSKTLELARGKNAIEVADGEELLATLALLRSAVLAGELDTQMEAASRALKERFQS